MGNAVLRATTTMLSLSAASRPATARRTKGRQRTRTAEESRHRQKIERGAEPAVTGSG
ncbi:hypothetical protein [Streptomyces sp. NPDC057460]|uniref:hypothetical protein n=1 Tax=Streptomyces sp. NPDC057460 TaxID=3346141 RepID=UPI0036786A0A